jgi:hypothetical protein
MHESVALAAAAVVQLLEARISPAAITAAFETEVLPRFAACVMQDVAVLHEMLAALDAPR